MQPPLSGSAPTFFALIIGADQSDTDTSGSVADARDIAAFLTQYLGISDDNIVILLNDMATRANIINQILSLTTDSRISWNDPILIYYAGNTSIVRAPEGWQIGSTDGRTSLLSPYDTSPTFGLSQDSQSIPDMMLNSLLEELAAAKGNNIVRPLRPLYSAAFILL